MPVVPLREPLGGARALSFRTYAHRDAAPVSNVGGGPTDSMLACHLGDESWGANGLGRAGEAVSTDERTVSGTRGCGRGWGELCARGGRLKPPAGSKPAPHARGDIFWDRSKLGREKVSDQGKGRSLAREIFSQAGRPTLHGGSGLATGTASLFSLCWGAAVTSGCCRSSCGDRRSAAASDALHSR